jgi:HNH endonuclease
MQWLWLPVVDFYLRRSHDRNCISETQNKRKRTFYTSFFIAKEHRLKIARWFDRCIICLRTNCMFTNEHVIPSSIGGILQCDFLCFDCNSKFGHTFDATAKSDPAIRQAIAELQTELPSLYRSIENGQKHLISTNAGQIIGRYRDGEIVHGGSKLADGTLLVPDDKTKQHLTNMLKRSGSGDAGVDTALARYQSAPFDVGVVVSDGIALTRREASHVGPDLTNSKPIDPLVVVKVAYEFSVLVLGEGILEPRFNEIRRCLIENDNSSNAFNVEPLEADKFDTFHGIAFEGNLPHATIQVRLFGKLAYRIHLFGIGFDQKPINYTQDLKTGKDEIRWSTTSP